MSFQVILCNKEYQPDMWKIFDGQSISHVYLQFDNYLGDTWGPFS